MHRNMKKYIGLMSGTSLDGIDASIISTNGNELDIQSLGQNFYQEYTAEISQKIMEVINQGVKLEKILELEREITLLHAEVVVQIGKKFNINLQDIEAIGFHGQTIFHNGENKLTLQLGNGQLLSQILGVNVVYNFRQLDLIHGGQGAPLVPIYHLALVKALNINTPVAFCNIGGVANITIIPNSQDLSLISGDVGTGCALINDLVLENFALNYDNCGQLAAQGAVNLELVKKMVQNNEFFSAKFPKSLDRNHFKYILNLPEFSQLQPLDKIATMTYFTAKSIALHTPGDITQLIIMGGGAKNHTIVQFLRSLLPMEIENIAHYGVPENYVESQAFAFLAARRLQNLPISFPGTTGVAQPITGGIVIPKL